MTRGFFDDAFTKGGSEGQSYEETIAIFRENLEWVDFTTPSGRAAAHDGRRYVESFLERLRQEL